MVNSVLEETNFGRVDPGSERFHRGADLSCADLSGARIGGAYNLDVAVTEDVIGLRPQPRT
jgi:hypothetical protein